MPNTVASGFSGSTARVVLSLAALLAGCGSAPPAAPEADTPAASEPQDAAAGAPIHARFDCEGEIVPVVLHEDRAVVSLADRDVTLPLVTSGPAGRYSNGTETFSRTDGTATLEIARRTRTCQPLPNPWQAARERGIDIRAVGQEPGWFLEIDHETTMRLVHDYGEQEVVVPASPPEVAGGRTTYAAAAGGRRLTVTVDGRRCQDGMSGEPLPSTVVVTIDGRELRGCGRALDGR